MRAALLSLLLLWQLAPALSGRAADSRPLRYQRDVQLPPDAAGQACAVLDAGVFAHAASRSANDLRLFGRRPGGAEREVPFAMTESAAQAARSQTATVRDASVRDGDILIDVTMPPRTYTEVDLELDAKNFLGEAQVWGVDKSGVQQSLGSYSVFDLSTQGLGRSTSLPLAESAFPALHIELRLTDPDGHPLPQLSAAIVTGVTVPPSRSAQTLYTTVASSGVETVGGWSVASLTLPPHVPIERVRFVLNPGYTRDFLRDVTIAATPIGRGYGAVGVAESVSGQILQVQRRAAGDIPAIYTQQLFVDATLGANLRAPAKVMASVHNGTNAPLPIESVELQMRLHELCFQASPGTSYVLRYGNPSLLPPVYSYARSFVPSSRSPIAAVLGPERSNPKFDPHADAAPKSRSETPWVVLMALIVICGVVALQYMRHKENQS